MAKRKNKVGTAQRKRKTVILIVALAIAVMLVSGYIWYKIECDVKYTGKETVRIYIPYGSTETSITDSLRVRLGNDFATQVMKIWNWRNGSAEKAEGSYVVKPGETASALSNKLRLGMQDAVRITFNNVRFIDQLAERVASRMQFEAEDFMEACDSILPKHGFSKPEYAAAFLPDTYEFYWSSDPEKVVIKLLEVRDKWWTPERKKKAEQLGLTEAEIATVASIVEEETAKKDERPKVARLYLNRIEKGMRLQADPTVKFGIGDFSLRRITNEHLKVDTPYNTYLHDGLPPGPIRVVESATLDDVLNAPKHDYIFMCAKEDFSGYHNFARTGAEHAANARRYHEALNRRNIH